MNFNDFMQTLHYCKFLRRCAQTYKNTFDRMNFYLKIADMHLFPNNKGDIAIYNFCLMEIERL